MGPGTEPPVVVATEVERAFGEHLALRDVSLSVRRREIHALLGPNGAGKTTLLRLLAGAVSPTSGRLHMVGIDAAQGGTALRRLVGLVPAGDRTLYLRISAFENLVFFGRLQGLPRRVARARAGTVLEQVGLAAHMHRPVNRYSHGMQKRVAVARALLTKPAVLLVDEATHDLDPEGSERVRVLIRKVADGGTAVLWATQRLEEVNGFADRVTVLDGGVVRFAGSVSALVSLAGSRGYVVEFANGAEPSAAACAALAGQARLSRSAQGGHLLVLAPGERLGAALAALEAAGAGVLDCREERSRLEDVFLTLTRPAA